MDNPLSRQKKGGIYLFAEEYVILGLIASGLSS